MRETTEHVDFFISYTHNDERWAEWIAWQLEDAGFSTLLQAWDFQAGSNFVLAMDDATKKATRTIAVLSPDYFQSQFTPPEWAAAFHRDPKGEQRLLLPVRVRPCDVEGLLYQIVYVDLVDLDEATARAKLLTEAGRKRRKPLVTPAFPSHSSAPSSSSRPSFPGALPTIWNIPYPRNPYFTGREDLLSRLAAALRSGQTVGISQPQAISGLGGVGKTQIALEYTYRYYQDYDAVLWCRADTQEALISGFVAFANLLHLPVQEERDQMKIVQEVKTWLSTHACWLLILDDADNLSLAQSFLPPAGQGHTLLTTRASSTGRLAQLLKIDSLSREQGALLLLRRTGRLAPDAPLKQAQLSDQTIAFTIAEELGSLPLALDQAGAYIEETQCSFSDYLQFYNSQRSQLLNTRGGLVPDHPDPVAATWSLSFEKVKTANPVAADLLSVCAFLASEGIPVNLFLSSAECFESYLQSVATNPFILNEAIAELLKYSLISRDSGTHLLSIHRLVQAMLRSSMDEETQKQWAKQVIRAVNHVFPDVSFEVWSLCQQYLTHSLICAKYIEQWDMHFSDAARLLNQTGYYLAESGQYAEALPLYQRALTIYKETPGPSHPDTASCLYNLASNYLHQAQYELAEPLFEQALEIHRHALGAEHPNVAASLNGLAQLYKEQGKYQQAEPLFLQARDITQKALGDEHTFFASVLNNLADLYQDQGKYQQAEPLFLQARDITKKALGDEHPSLATTLNALAAVYEKQGKYQQAESLFNQARDINQKALGAKHPSVAINLNNLAQLYVDQGKIEQAEHRLKQALELLQDTLGPVHPYLARPLNILGQIYQKQGKEVEAEQQYQRAIAIIEQNCGELHPSLARILDNYASLLRKNKRKEEAMALEVRLRAILEKLYS